MERRRFDLPDDARLARLLPVLLGLVAFELACVLLLLPPLVLGAQGQLVLLVATLLVCVPPRLKFGIPARAACVRQALIGLAEFIEPRVRPRVPALALRPAMHLLVVLAMPQRASLLVDRPALLGVFPLDSLAGGRQREEHGDCSEDGLQHGGSRFR